jgi:S1-C subfamily serine protease
MKFVEKSKKLLKDYRVLLLIFFLVGSLLAISPMPGRDGVVIRSIAKNSSAFDAGMQFDSKARPTARERILSIDTMPINTEDEFYSYVSTIEANRTVRITTNVKTYQLTSGAGGELGLKVAPAPTNNIRKGLDLVGGIRAV